MDTETQSRESSLYSNYPKHPHRPRSFTFARFATVVFLLAIIIIPASAHPQCPGQKKECSCSCKLGAGAQKKKERAKNCAAMQNNGQIKGMEHKKSCAKKNNNKKAQGRRCSKSGPAVCAQPPMPLCPPDKMCAQVMPQVRWFRNRCAAEKEGATVMADSACQVDLAPQ
jgi:hypothetical protein